MSLNKQHLIITPDENQEQTRTKAMLEEQKLRLEIEELQKPWFKKPAFAVPVFGALSTFFVLLITGFFTTNTTALNTKKDLLSIDIYNLNKEKDTLKVKKLN